ncbi:IMP dehydrogenase [Puniceicoccus vermicola]|uniref:IMP dehydrogenase n=1 Tax=Puniceicoccus vermicola TaxID=388746 RepID=A0A7X1E7A5_9BACT|nr:IMP dehydrogenase [Puniceicoccus vermicola]MBC2603517.1 IMP dehydrogenase [Puniceicoccus vermicola]
MSSFSPYLNADDFFPSMLPTGLTFDDVSLATRYSEVLPRQASLNLTLSKRISLHLPIVSSDMDTVTESNMAIAMALQGGLGIVHYNMSEKQQVREVARVKNYVNGLIQDPFVAHPEQTIGDVLELVERKNVKFRTFPVVDQDEKLVGLLPGRVVKERYRSHRVEEAMHVRSQVHTITESEIGENPVETADQFFSDHLGIHKLLVVDQEDRLKGLFTLSDIERISEEARSNLRPARDDRFRLLCGAAISAVRKADGSLDRDRIIGHVSNLVGEGLDALAVSTAHGFSAGVGESVRLLRSEFPDLTIIAGNVTSGDGVEYLADAGADIIKVGQGPGSICTTRQIAGVGIPQLTALYACSKAAKAKGVRILADGGISKSGDVVKALTLADAVMCGGLLAGCKEAPGTILEIKGKLYKQYRGMGSEAAMKAGSAARYGHAVKDLNRKVASEGIEALKEISGSVEEVISGLAGGLRSGMGYLGAKDLDALKENALYVRVSPAGQREASPHDVIVVKAETSEEG